MDDDAIDTEGLVAWLAAAVDPTISSATATKLAGGHSSGAWRVDAGGGHDIPPLVLKAPGGDSVVFRRDAGAGGAHHATRPAGRARRSRAWWPSTPAATRSAVPAS